MTATRVLLAGLIDHAPTFPPARLPRADALAEDRRVRESPEAWIVGRLVWPASRAQELDGYEAPLSLVLDVVPLPDGRPVEAVETRWPALPEFAGEVFVELPPGEDLAARLDSIREAGALAKVRCGGETAPSTDDLAGFIRACAEADVPFKASAGLHHPVRRGETHGFLNLLAAALWPGEAEAALAEEEPAEFAFSGTAFSWRDRRAGATDIARMRRERFRSFGSCSVAEPVNDLRALGIL